MGICSGGTSDIGWTGFVFMMIVAAQHQLTEVNLHCQIGRQAV
jgi:hypothetical protein